MNEIESVPAAIVPPIEYLRECFHYEAETGRLLWKERPLHHFPNLKTMKTFLSRGYIGKEFGRVWFQRTTKKPGGKMGRLIYQGHGYSVHAHRIVWMIHFGPIPDNLEIDHKDTNPLNNRLDNLRLATHSQNIANAANYRRKNNLPRGVYRLPSGRFQSMIRKDGKLICIGTFDTPEEAHAAFKKKASELHGEFSNHLGKEVLPG